MRTNASYCHCSLLNLAKQKLMERRVHGPQQRWFSSTGTSLSELGLVLQLWSRLTRILRADDWCPSFCHPTFTYTLNAERLEHLQSINKDMHEANKKSRKQNRDLEGKFVSLQNEANSWLELARLTQPITPFLVRFLRTSQASLTTIVVPVSFWLLSTTIYVYLRLIISCYITANICCY